MLPGARTPVNGFDRHFMWPLEPLVRSWPESVRLPGNPDYRLNQEKFPRLTIREGQCLKDDIQIERFGDERPTSASEKLLQVRAHDVAREEDDAIGELGPVLLPLLEDLLARDVGHAHVEKDGIELTIPCGRH